MKKYAVVYVLLAILMAFALSACTKTAEEAPAATEAGLFIATIILSVCFIEHVIVSSLISNKHVFEDSKIQLGSAIKRKLFISDGGMLSIQ